MKGGTTSEGRGRERLFAFSVSWGRTVGDSQQTPPPCVLCSEWALCEAAMV